ncbi:MAG: type IV toxin-antitoxin system AbiEi family antitoxin [Cytophagaceae bacterium]
MEQEIVHIALENLNQITGIQAFYQNEDPLDGVLEMTVNGRKHTFTVEVKREIRTHQLQEVEDYFHNHENFLLIANRIFPKIKEELRQKEIPYLEANGNIFLKKEGLFLLVDNQKTLDIEKNKGNRAFTKTGLKVLFYLLHHRDAINLTQRELAEKAEVGLGNIPQVIEGLKETGYLIPLNNKTYVWENRKALLERWIADYATVLRPKLVKERYTLKGNWQEIPFENQKTVWGGEPAADMLTNHLRPEKFLVYTKENRMDLIKNYRLMPDKNGEVEVLDMFWKKNDGKTAPPIVVYADLMLEGGKRNNETAVKIYHEYIEPNL